MRRQGWIAVGAVGLLWLSTKLAVGFKNGVSTWIWVKAIGDGHKLRSDVAEAFGRMREAAKAAGIQIKINSSFRSWNEQAILYAKHLIGGPVAAKPGYSNHQGGTAVDIETANGTNAAFRWLNGNAAKFGFRRTVTSEPWHWEYVA